MYKSDIHQSPNYFDRYVDVVPDISLEEALVYYGDQYYREHMDLLQHIGSRVYAEGKWTMKQIVQHLIDTERVFQYRAMRFARRDVTMLPGFDEEVYAQVAEVNRRTLEDLLEEWKLLRQSGLALFKSFTPEDLQSKGVAFNCHISVLSIGYMLAGHPIHHMNVIKERYIF